MQWRIRGEERRGRVSALVPTPAFGPYLLGNFQEKSAKRAIFPVGAPSPQYLDSYIRPCPGVNTQNNLWRCILMTNFSKRNCELTIHLYNNNVQCIKFHFRDFSIASISELFSIHSDCLTWHWCHALAAVTHSTLVNLLATYVIRRPT